MLAAFLSSWKYIFLKKSSKIPIYQVENTFSKPNASKHPIYQVENLFSKTNAISPPICQVKKKILKQIPAVVHIKLWIYFLKKILAARRPFWANNSSADFPPGQDTALKKLRTQDPYFSIMNRSWHIKPFEVDFVHKRYMLEDKAVTLKANCWHLWQICD